VHRSVAQLSIAQLSIAQLLALPQRVATTGQRTPKPLDAHHSCTALGIFFSQVAFWTHKFETVTLPKPKLSKNI